MSQSVISTPGFPHGDHRGYFRGCNCAPCREAMRRYRNWTNLRRAEGQTLPADRVDTAEVRDHLQAILDADPTVTLACLARASGVSHQAIRPLMAGKTETIRHDKRVALLAVTVHDARDARAQVPRAEVEPLIRQLQAAGYPLAWIVLQGALTHTAWLYTDRPNVTVKRKQVEALRALHAAYADIPATPEAIGLDESYLEKARAAARRHGYWPVWYLDADGNLDPRSIPDHPWSQLDERAAHMLDVLRDAAAGYSLHETSERRGEQIRQVSRWLRAAGLRVTEPAAIARVKALLDEYDYCDADPVDVALRIGVLVDTHLLCADHPVVVAHRARLKAERAASAYAA